MSQEFRIEIPQIDPRWSRSLVPLAAIVIAGLALLFAYLPVLQRAYRVIIKWNVPNDDDPSYKG